VPLLRNVDQLLLDKRIARLAGALFAFSRLGAVFVCLGCQDRSPRLTFRPLPAEIPAAHRIQVGSLPGPSFAMTGCSGFQPAQLTGENKPGLGGNEKPQLILRFASRLHRFLF
jgi:hypothetical protein